MLQTLRISNEAEWAVKQVLAERRTDAGGVEYKVDWEGNWAPTWEPPECLEHAQDKVRQFKDRAAGAKLKTAGKRKRG